MNLQKTILFDIDYTLINTEIIREKRVKSLVKFTKKSRAEVINESNRYIESLESTKDYHPRELAKCLSMAWGYKTDILFKQIWNKETISKTNFPETMDVLEDLKSRYQLGIYSEGFEKIQKYKLRANGISKFFDPKLIYVVRRKIINLPVRHLGKVIIVDDNKEIVKFLKDYKNVKIIWINRKTKRKMNGVKTIFNLKELKSAIE